LRRPGYTEQAELMLFAFAQPSKRCYNDIGRFKLPCRRASPLAQLNFESKGKHMTRDEVLSRISIDPSVCFGKPCIRGHRIWVSFILDLLASGQSIEDILADYPQLAREDIYACIAYGAEMSRERYIDITG
jgi:uncharacterized protein (DUF433 family)